MRPPRAGPPGRPDVDAFEARVRAWVEQSCEAQGVPTRIDNPDVLAAVACLLSPAATPEAITPARPGRRVRGRTG